jgi:hypothetical protein
MDLYYCGVIESIKFIDFPYSAQPILCTPDGQVWRRIEYRLRGAKVVHAKEIGEALSLEQHSFTRGDYVLVEPRRFHSGNRLVVFPGHTVVATRWAGELCWHLVMRSLQVPLSSQRAYWRQGLIVSLDYFQRRSQINELPLRVF